jgi:RHS repeat-associated protein
VAFGIGDSLNSTYGITNAAGAIAQKFNYEPFGQLTGTADSAYPFAFTGRVPIVGNIVYFRNRFYDASTGTFLSEDPLDFAGSGTNLYAYAGNSPESAVDPSGLCLQVGKAFALAAVGGAGGALVGATGGSAVLPLVGTVSGAVIGGVVGFVGVFASSLISDAFEGKPCPGEEERMAVVNEFHDSGEITDEDYEYLKDFPDYTPCDGRKLPHDILKFRLLKGRGRDVLSASRSRHHVDSWSWYKYYK